MTMRENKASVRRHKIERLIEDERFQNDPKGKKLFKKALGIITSEKPDFLKGAKLFTKVMRNTEDLSDKAYCADWVGRCCEAGSDTERAVICYLGALRFDESDVFALKKLADYYHGDDFEKAESYYKRALNYDPASADTYYRLGKLYGSADNSDKAIEYYMLAIKINNNYVAPIAEAAIEYAKKGDKKNVLKYFSLAAANDINEIKLLEDAVKTYLAPGAAKARGASGG